MESIILLIEFLLVAVVGIGGLILLFWAFGWVSSVSTTPYWWRWLVAFFTVGSILTGIAGCVIIKNILKSVEGFSKSFPYAIAICVLLVIGLFLLYCSFLILWLRFKWFRIAGSIVFAIAFPIIILSWVLQYFFGNESGENKSYRVYKQQLSEINSTDEFDKTRKILDLKGKNFGFTIGREYRAYKKLAKKGNTKAQLWLGESSHTSKRKRIVWLEKAATQGSSKAMFSLAKKYERGMSLDGVKKDETEAFKWYLKAAKKGHAESQFRVGFYYGQGKGIPKNHKEEYVWYQKAAKKGVDLAQLFLAERYISGSFGIEIDYEKALELFEIVAKSADADCTKASGMYGLGNIYRNGLGVDADLIKAIEWYEQAAKKGNEAAKKAWSEIKGIDYDLYHRPMPTLPVEKPISDDDADYMWMMHHIDVSDM